MKLLLAVLALSAAAPMNLSYFNATKGEAFDVKIAAICVELSAAAYCNNDAITPWTCPPCADSGVKLNVTDILYAAATGTHGYIGIDISAKLIVVAFQGTHNLRQWLDDLNFFKTDLHYPGAGSDVMVHQGFYKAYTDVKYNVDRIVNATLRANPGYSILVTGHSLGAALAVMCSLDLRIMHPDVRILHYTFGQPRVGNAAFADFYSKAGMTAAYRMVHNHDIVPHLPLESMGFHHIATEVFYTETYSGPSSLHVCDGSGEDPKCSDQFLIDVSVSDHLNYMGKTLDTDACSAFSGFKNLNLSFV